jgi:UDP-N-acetylglucosamine--N-acetylmuramyl-(pentapeptide) pyrophosphoryl-undecaprenol N-acetylglucosamine transferase
VLFFTGGYVAVPMALAGVRVPTLLYVPDIEPGLALKTLARFADRIAVSTQDSCAYFKHPERVTLTGYPIRAGLDRWTPAEARRALKLDTKTPVLLVWGGSKGAHSLNNAVLANLPALLEMVQVVHVTGELDWPEVEAKAGTLNNSRYHAFPYLHEEMGAALSAADIVLSRAGASTLGEYPQFGLPSILVPYPYAWRYQKVNADYLVRNGAAVIVEDKQLSEQLLPALKSLLESPSRLDDMRRAVKSLSHPEAPAEIGDLLLALAGERR